MKDAKTAAVSREELKPLIRYAAGPHGHGFVIQVKRELDRRTGKTWRRENVGRWLDADPETWTHPLHGAGVLVREIGIKLIEKREADRKSKTITDDSGKAWRPFRTAPKDGQTVELKQTKTGSFCLGYWSDVFDSWMRTSNQEPMPEHEVLYGWRKPSSPMPRPDGVFHKDQNPTPIREFGRKSKGVPK